MKLPDFKFENLGMHSQSNIRLNVKLRLIDEEYTETDDNLASLPQDPN
jgi:hypothetical protein